MYLLPFQVPFKNDSNGIHKNKQEEKGNQELEI